jgi:hypothetical protein
LILKGGKQVANNRITYSTAQVAIKDTNKRLTNYVEGGQPVLTLSSGVSAVDSEIAFNETVQNVWPASGQFRVDSEFIYYGVVLDTNTVGELVRGDFTTAAAHLTGASGTLNGWEVPMGMQTASVSTAFNLEDVFHIGQLESYENIEGIPDIEVTFERVLDGTKPLWSMCTDPNQSTLKGRTADFKCDVAISVFPDVQESATGTEDSVCFCSGNYVSALTFTMPVDGNFTESMTLVGNDKTWTLAADQVASGHFPTADSYDATVVGAGVQRTEDFDVAGSTLPGDLPNDDHIQSITVSADIGREEIYELGSKRPYYRAVTFPLTVTSSFEVITSAGDKVEALSDRDNLTDRQITLKTLGGLTINCGAKNKLSSVTFGGFDAGGGNGSVTMEFQNSNSLTVTHTAG